MGIPYVRVNNVLMLVSVVDATVWASISGILKKGQGGGVMVDRLRDDGPGGPDPLFISIVLLVIVVFGLASFLHYC